MTNYLRHLFTPHHTNNHKAKVLHLSSLAVLLVLLIVSQLVTLYLPQRYPDILGFASSIPVSRVIELTNAERAKLQLAPLSVDDRLSDAARRKAADMITHDYWAHSSPSGVTPWSFVLAAGYQYIHAGENLARDFSSADSAVAAWMNSPSHRDNLLSSRYQNIGVAVVDGKLGGVETTLIVQMFGAPQTAKKATASTNTLAKPVLAATQSPQPTDEPAPAVDLPDSYPTPTPILDPTVSAVYLSTLNPLLLTKITSFAFAFLVIFILALDWLMVLRNKIIRLSGKNWAHLTFLFTVCLIIILLRPGLIL
ncbi:hypothetical protein A2368_04200 [Candidatus Collierbacteria bacterium RIFOXYB1_FULL_49_13]|uniref:SCP domain-containing protein n=1 Tax=Candidatus Collierbacteria bacterium RIFOXYB1_FULL_49_13 TaxID=1817728 RepID=A0A1F5FHB0_9BACT|nr:MAG: hypothetical protein A2368_04200 [Candidatus Collierbacteria bacterium RIFOXYB1_FULL_49_13]